MSVYEHDYGIPTEDELSALVGAATPHFAFQIRDRVAAYAALLPRDHPRAAELTAHLERLDRLGLGGETGRVARPDLPPRKSLPALYPG
ncbi:MAG: hypothetical protein ACLGG9_05360 [Thermoleophilia bacterium]|jgi:hypothetical protein